MKKAMLFTVLLVCVSLCPAFASDVLKGPLPEKLPPPEKCSNCHNVPQIYKEIVQSVHNGLKCLDCHLPGCVQKAKYESSDCSFLRTGYHEKDGNWVEATGNEVCLRCHRANGISDTDERCWSCHMPQEGVDKFVIVKDKKLPPTGDNVREIKNLPHKSHVFKVHSKGKAKH